MTCESFGTLADGRPVERLTIAAGDLTVRILTFGAALQDLRLAGVAHPLTLGSDDLADYQGPMRYAGTIVGPVANRIAGASAEIDGRRHHFEANDGRNTLHGGRTGTQGRVWEVLRHGSAELALGLTLDDGEGGFPGNRRITARFVAEAPARLTLTLAAETDAPTLVNLANHSYWRLGGPGAPQELRSPAERYLPTGAENLPTGEIAPVESTRFDFRTPRRVGGQGYDHCLCLARARRPLTRAAELAGGGLRMAMETTEPGLQVFDGHAEGWVALEAQGWPDAPNRPEFPSILLRPGTRYEQVTRWRFERD